jgi:hypothetical protein
LPDAVDRNGLELFVCGPFGMQTVSVWPEAAALLPPPADVLPLGVPLPPPLLQAVASIATAARVATVAASLRVVTSASLHWV